MVYKITETCMDTYVNEEMFSSTVGFCRTKEFGDKYVADLIESARKTIEDTKEQVSLWRKSFDKDEDSDMMQYFFKLEHEAIIKAKQTLESKFCIEEVRFLEDSSGEE